MAVDKEAVGNALRDYWGVLKEIFKFYCEGARAFELLSEDIARIKDEALSMAKRISPDIDPGKVDMRTTMVNGLSLGQAFDSFYGSSIEDLQNRNAVGGSNLQRLGNMCICLIYSYWEDHYRGELREALGLRDGPRADIWGDIARIRHSVIHHQSVALDAIDKNVLLKWFHPGDAIVTIKEHLVQIRQHASDYFSEIVERHGLNAPDENPD